MWKHYPWIQIHYIPTNCTGLFQPRDVGIQRVLSLVIRHTALRDTVNDTIQQLQGGAEPNEVVFQKKLGIVRDQSVGWLVHAYDAINEHELVEKVCGLLNHPKLPNLT